MKKLTLPALALSFVLLIASGFTKVQAQGWIIGIGANVVDDNGYKFSNLFEVEKSWNILPYPSRLSVEKILPAGFSLEAVGTINKLEAGKMIDRVVLSKTTDYFAIDVDLKYNLSFILDSSKFLLKPYVLVGYGYSDRGIHTTKVEDVNKVVTSASTGGFTHDLGAGFNIWLTKSQKLGLGIQSMAKFMNKQSSNHIQHSLTILYKI